MSAPMTQAQKEQLGFLGLLLDFAGALVVTWGTFFMTPEQAVWLAAPRFGGTYEEMLQLPQVQNLLAEVRINRIGMLLVTCGFFLQLCVGWPGLPRWASKRPTG